MTNLGYFQRFSWKVEDSWPPLKWQNTGVKHFNFFKICFLSLDVCMFKLNLKRHPSVPRLIEKKFVGYFHLSHTRKMILFPPRNFKLFACEYVELDDDLKLQEFVQDLSIKDPKIGILLFIFDYKANGKSQKRFCFKNI